MSALGTDGSHAVVLLLLDTQHYGLLIAQIFFGLWLVPLGYLAYKSAMFPRALAVVLVVGGVCYLVDLLAAFLLPAFSQQFHTFIVIPCAIAEIWMVLYLLVWGVRTVKPVGESSPRRESQPHHWLRILGSAHPEVIGFATALSGLAFSPWNLWFGRLPLNGAV